MARAQEPGALLDCHSIRLSSKSAAALALHSREDGAPGAGRASGLPTIVGSPVASSSWTPTAVRLPRQGAFPGRDPTKVDRYLAENDVEAGLAQRCPVRVAYAIGIAEPLAPRVNCHARDRGLPSHSDVHHAPPEHPHALRLDPRLLRPHRALWTASPGGRAASPGSESLSPTS